jgi:hypothetical protein
LFHAETQAVPAYFTTAQIEQIETEEQRTRAAVAGELRAFARPHLARDVEVVVGDGPPQEAIVRMAPGFDLIALGTHRRHGPQRWWLGSVAEAVVRRSPRPVLVVPAGARAIDATPAPRILVAGVGHAVTQSWVDALRIALGGEVTHTTDISHCSADRLRSVDLIVFSISTAAHHEQVKAVAHLLKECLHPVLFVPLLEDTVERSSS